MSKIKLFILHGTSRENNRSAKAAKYIKKIAQQRDNLDITYKSVSDYDISDDGINEDNKSEEYTKIITEMDAMVIIVPEYNHSFPGSLKRLLDSEYKLYRHKPVSLVGVSAGRFSGARAVEHLVPVARELGLINIQNSVFIGKIKESVAEDGESAEDFVTDSINTNLDQLIWYAKALKWGRENLDH